jgi:hypothetical protein
MTNRKSQLGQFYTTNYEYILKDMYIPETAKHIIEPFAGNGDLLKFIKTPNEYTIECYDIDPKHNWIVLRDTLYDPPDYNNKFILTNPPYLARNKNTEKELYDKYDCNDLYKCFLVNVIQSECNGGIIIIPLNFVSSIRKKDVELRKRFFDKYNIEIVNIFEESVFDDTSCSVCSIQFQKRIASVEYPEIQCTVYPTNQKLDCIVFNAANNYTIGGEIYNLPKNPAYKIERATKKTNNENCTNIVLKTIDDSITNKLQLKMVHKKEDRVIDDTANLSVRSYASLVITPVLSHEK